MTTITAENLASHELIGLDAAVRDSTNPCMVGLNGRVIDETRSMIIIAPHAKNRQRHLHIPKHGTVFDFSRAGARIGGSISGNDIAKRPFDRVVGR